MVQIIGSVATVVFSNDRKIHKVFTRIPSIITKLRLFVARMDGIISPITNKNNKNEASVIPHPLS